MTADEVIEIALDYARAHGRDTEQYEVSADQTGDEWHVFFQGKELLPGNFFSVFVDDQSGAAKALVPGK
jgi:hypothetical protein